MTLWQLQVQLDYPITFWPFLVLSEFPRLLILDLIFSSFSLFENVKYLKMSHTCYTAAVAIDH